MTPRDALTVPEFAMLSGGPQDGERMPLGVDGPPLEINVPPPASPIRLDEAAPGAVSAGLHGVYRLALGSAYGGWVRYDWVGWR